MKKITDKAIFFAFAILVVGGLLTAFFAPESAAANDPTGRGVGFSAVLYDNTNGLPTSDANAVVQTSEGFIWIGSYSGLPCAATANSYSFLDEDGTLFIAAATGVSAVNINDTSAERDAVRLSAPFLRADDDYIPVVNGEAFDAMYSTRPYRRRMELDDIVAEIRRVSGTQLNEKVVEALYPSSKKALSLTKIVLING